MKPEEIVVSLEWAKKLKEAGWKQDDVLVFTGIQPVKKTDEERFETPSFRSRWKLENLWDWVSAPTAEEILRRLPRKIAPMSLTEMDERTIKGNIPDLRFQILMDGPDWKIEYSSPHLESAEWQYGETLANAAANMFIYLSENNLLPPLKDL